MYDSATAQNAYAQSARSTASPRTLEYKVFSQTTARLASAIAAPKSAFPELAAALHANLKLWLVIATDVASETNDLPTDLRGQLFSLADYVRQYTPKVLRDEEDPAILIEINTAVMRGLRGEVNSEGAV